MELQLQGKPPPPDAQDHHDQCTKLQLTNAHPTEGANHPPLHIMEPDEIEIHLSSLLYCSTQLSIPNTLFCVKRGS